MKYKIVKVPIKWNNDYMTGYIIKKKVIFNWYRRISKTFLSKIGAEISLKKKYQK